ncbi:MAG: hypothetical protein KDJ98_08185 [Rhodobacteraceae bacterium]|nr:hypothetical protein [Paracoccaceae bacterium]
MITFVSIVLSLSALFWASVSGHAMTVGKHSNAVIAMSIALILWLCAIILQVAT